LSALAQMPPSLFTGLQTVKESTPWPRALSYSTGTHSLLLLLLIFFGFQKEGPVKTYITEINFIEKPKVGVALTPVETTGVSGAKDSRGTVGATLKNAQPVESHQDLPKNVPVSSPQGSAQGTVVTAMPMTGPIVPVGEIGMIGKKKAALLPMTGATEGRRVTGTMTVATGKADEAGPQIALATQDIGDIKKKESSLGLPLVSDRVVADSMGDRMKVLASNSLGERRKPAAESLKANPFDKEKWGKAKGPFSIEGPLKYRKIVKMELPIYPRWAEEQGIEASVSFRLWVDPKGKVKDNMYLEKASGYSELDGLAKQALSKFVFIQLPSDQPQEDEWGVATFRFEFSKK